MLDLLRHGRAGRYLWESKRTQGWIRGPEAVALWNACLGLPETATVVEIGAFLGCSTVLLAGARKLRRGGMVHTVDPFTGDGDPFSLSIYREIAEASAKSLRERFDENMRRADVTGFLQVHQSTAADAVMGWSEPIDLLYLDGDQSPAGARQTFLSWSRFLRLGGTLVINNTATGSHPPEHDGSVRVVHEFVKAPTYDAVRSVEALTFATRSR